jgi:hypothetical protein
MKVRAWFAAAAPVAVAVLVACSSSSKGGTSSAPTCQGAAGMTGAGTAACSSCLQNSCASQLSSVEASCGAYITCYQGCQCSDLACLQGCLSKVDSTCQNPQGSFVMCLSQNCVSQCTTTTTSDAGSD